jgi:micrococcal nuclease
MIEEIIRIFNILIISALISLNSWGLNISEIPENKVIKVVDGDTIEIYLNKKIEKVRLIGVNTPETVDPRRKVECFGPEASNRLKELLEGKVVKVEADETQNDSDKYQRLLRYVYLDNININQKMIEEGYGFEYTYKVPYKYQREFKKSQQEAKSKNLGLWNQENCNY